MAILQKGEYFGEEELLKNQKRKMTIFCDSGSGVLYILNKEEFIKRIYNDERTYQALLEQIAWRNNFFKSRINKFISTSREMQAEIEKKEENCLEKSEKNNNTEFMQKIIPKKANIGKKIITRRLNFCKSMIHPEDVVKTLQNSKIKGLGFGVGANSPKQNFFMLKAFAKYQEKEKESSTEKQQKTENVPKQLKKEQNFTIIQEKEKKNHRKIMTISLTGNSFINMPVNKENIVDFLTNTEFGLFRTPKEGGFKRIEGFRSSTAEVKGSKHLNTETLIDEIWKREEILRDKSGDLPLKYRSEQLKSSKAKKSLKKYFQCSPTNTQFFKTFTCF